MSPLSTIFLIYHDGYFLLAYKTIDRPQVTDIVHHIKMYRINLAMDENRTHNFKEKSLNIHRIAKFARAFRQNPMEVK
jgi:hypothetical protein